jgi:hypothetical protein
MQCSVLVGDRDYWRSGKDGEYAIDKKMVAVQGSFCSATLLIIILIHTVHCAAVLKFSAFFTAICNLTHSLHSRNYPMYLNEKQLN